MSDSARTKHWTLERAQGAVKAAFFAKEVLSRGEEPDAKLHFSEIRELIDKNERDISDRTLSRAISQLVLRGQLKKSGTGRGIVYTLEIPKPERLRAFARADSAWVERSAQVGGVGDMERGYAVYGVPEILLPKYRNRLRKEAIRHQSRMRAILGEVWDDCADSLLRPARGRIPRKVWSAGQAAILRFHRVLVIGTLAQSYAARTWQALEETIPGALGTFQKSLGVTFAPETPVQELIAVIVSKVSGVDRQEVQPYTDRMLKRITKDWERTRPLWNALTPAERERAERRMAAAVAISATLTSVVHS